MKILPNNLLIELLFREEIMASGIIVPEHRGLNRNYGVIKKVGRSTFAFQHDYEEGDLVYFRNDKKTHLDEKKNLVVVPTYAVFCIDRGEQYESIAERYISPYNFVMTKFVDNTTIKTKTGIELALDTSWNKEKTAPTMGTVVKNPERLVYNGYTLSNIDKYTQFGGDILRNSCLDWDTELETSVGDLIHFHYLQIDTIKREGLYIKHNLEVINFVRYDKIMGIEHEDHLQPINGYVFVDMPLLDTVTMTEAGVYKVDEREEQFRRNFGQGTVKAMGKPNRHYRNYPDDGETDQIQVGDEIVFQDYRRSKVGRDLVIQTSKALDLYRIQRRDIHYIK